MRPGLPDAGSAIGVLMRWIPLLALLFVAPPARASLGGPSHGMYAQIAGGGGMLVPPLGGAIGWQAGGGGWIGRYDDDYALGRYWGFGFIGRQDRVYLPGGASLRTVPLIEVRRGMDLLVLGVQGYVAAGPLFSAQTGHSLQVGGAIRAGGGIKYRFKPHWGLTATAEAGVDILGGSAQARLALRLGVEFSTPIRKKSTPGVSR